MAQTEPICWPSRPDASALTLSTLLLRHLTHTVQAGARRKIILFKTRLLETDAYHCHSQCQIRRKSYAFYIGLMMNTRPKSPKRLLQTHSQDGQVEMDMNPGLISIAGRRH